MPGLTPVFTGRGTARAVDTAVNTVVCTELKSKAKIKRSGFRRRFLATRARLTHATDLWHQFNVQRSIIMHNPASITTTF